MKRRSSLAVALLVCALIGGAALRLWPQPQPAPVTHTVVRGDTLSKLARAHGVSVADLRSENGIKGDLIEVGQVLVIPLGGNASGVTRAPGTPHRSPRGRSGGGPRAKQAGAPAGGGSLAPPAPKPCLAGPSEDGTTAGNEPTFAASVGLSADQLTHAMDGFLPTLSRCLSPDEPAQGVLLLDLKVGCSGVVESVTVVDDGALDEALVGCVTRHLRAAPFPAHDMPDGMLFRYPMRFY